MVRHIAAIAVLALAPAHAWAQQCTTDPGNVIEAIYVQLLERPTANNEGADWAEQLRNGRTVREVVRQIAHSPEHLLVLVVEAAQRVGAGASGACLINQGG